MKNLYTVTLRKYRSTWHYFTNNPQGGGFGSNHCGSKAVALSAAMRGVPAGAVVQVRTYHGQELKNSIMVTRGKGENEWHAGR